MQRQRSIHYWRENFAGQAAMYLSKFAMHVYIIIRKGSLAASMSAYLIDQIMASDNISPAPFYKN
jgi:thioredoxin reductase (NADPH)